MKRLTLWYHKIKNKPIIVFGIESQEGRNSLFFNGTNSYTYKNVKFISDLYVALEMDVKNFITVYVRGSDACDHYDTLTCDFHTFWESIVPAVRALNNEPYSRDEDYNFPMDGIIE